VNARYVIATSQKVDLAGIDSAKIEEISQPKYFTAEKAQQKAGEEAFFKQGEKPEVRFYSHHKHGNMRTRRLICDLQKKQISSSRAADQKAIDKALLANIKKVDMLSSYLASSFSLRKGDKPHEMKW
jgi:large subunit ribosomal protein L6e